MAPHSVDDLARSFERHLRAGNKSPRTIETYLQAVGQFAAHLKPNRKANGGRGLADARGEGGGSALSRLWLAIAAGQAGRVAVSWQSSRGLSTRLTALRLSSRGRRADRTAVENAPLRTRIAGGHRGCDLRSLEHAPVRASPDSFSAPGYGSGAGFCGRRGDHSRMPPSGKRFPPPGARTTVRGEPASSSIPSRRPRMQCAASGSRVRTVCVPSSPMRSSRLSAAGTCTWRPMWRARWCRFTAPGYGWASSAMWG